ncbi:IgGFc-binding protein [Holothuria leucospilota]|uniref:IgGFc-binding protein n=1 Tax=Holothuria leucospilota TaxID=206669 RepID=A0A9Q1BUT2_HOLLE|nr:IgGFc-binding protein [Holothuria leucospilota]
MTKIVSFVTDGTSKAITTDIFNHMLSSMKPSTRVVEDVTTLFKITGASTPERTSVVLKTSSEGLATTVTQHFNETTQPHESTALSSTGSQFNNQQTTASKNVYITQSTQATEQPQFSTGVNDLSTFTEETSTSQSHQTTESNMITTHELTSNKVLTTETKVHSEQASTSGKFQSQGISTTMEPASTITERRTTKHTTFPLFTTKDHPTTEAENTTSKPTSSERNVTTKTIHSSKLNPVTTDSRSGRQNPISTFMHTIKQERSTKEITSSDISSTTIQDIKTTELSFSTMTTPARSGNFTTVRPTTPPLCPTNMVYMNCVCQSTCEYPNSTNSCYINCTEGEACICPDGFYLMGGNCVPPEECGCYYADGGVIIQESDTQLFNVCTRQCSCLSGVLMCNDFQCDINAICQNESGILHCDCNQGYYGDGLSCTRLTDCEDVYNAGLVDDDVYTILPMNWNGSAFEVYCKDRWTVSNILFF